FFFSSRRRHTRSKRDWSSDVCSSDLGTSVTSDVSRIQAVQREVGEDIAIRIDVNQGWQSSASTMQALDKLKDVQIDWLEQPVTRSEERRVGKECRSRWSRERYSE